MTTLRLLLPRLKKNQSTFVNSPALTIPPLLTPTHDILGFSLPINWLIELFIFNGTIYFENIEEQTVYCHCLALCPKSWTTTEEDLFENGSITTDGFVQNLEQRNQLQLYHARFNSNPVIFIKELLKNRNNTYPSITSHIGSIIFNSLKLL
ncbi:unnamed protein product [Adineta steineri]|nr:unnamed protein product [Adineta steineri]